MPNRAAASARTYKKLLFVPASGRSRTTVLLDLPLDDFRPEDFELYQ